MKVFAYSFISLQIIICCNLHAQTSPVYINGKYALADKKRKPITEPVYDTIIYLFQNIASDDYKAVITAGLREGKTGTFYDLRSFTETDSLTVTDTIVHEYFESGSVDLFNHGGSFLAGNITDIKIPSGTIPVKMLSYFEPLNNGWPENTVEGFYRIPAEADFFLFQKSGKWGAMDFQGKQIIPLILDPVEVVNRGEELLIAGINNEKLLLYNTLGNSIPYNHDRASRDFLSPCLFTDHRIVKVMIENGADRNYRDDSCSLLQKAIRTNNTEMWKMLTDKNAKGSRTSSSMREAVLKRNREVIRKLQEWEIDVSEPDEKGITAVHLAFAAEDEEILKTLLKPVKDMSAIVWSPLADSPVCWSDENHIQTKTKMLIEKKFNVNAMNGSSLHCAAEKGNVELIKILLDAGADKSLKNKEGKTAYQVAAERGFGEAAGILK